LKVDDCLNPGRLAAETAPAALSGRRPDALLNIRSTSLARKTAVGRNQPFEAPAAHGVPRGKSGDGRPLTPALQ
jgi:hypothetical protein